jgi:transposase InsO family protein
MPENAFAYRHSHAFHAAVAALDAKQKFIKPHCPWQNGYVERFSRTLQVEWAHRHVFLSNEEPAQALALWLETYNARCQHTVLRGLPPISRL